LNTSKSTGYLRASIPIWDTTFDEIKEYVAPESNKTTQGVELKVNISVTMAHESSAYFLLTRYTLPLDGQS